MAKEFRTLRKRLGLTQAEAAARLGVSRKHVSDIERGARVPSLTLRLAMAALARKLRPISE